MSVTEYYTCEMRTANRLCEIHLPYLNVCVSYKSITIEWRLEMFNLLYYDDHGQHIDSSSASVMTAGERLSLSNVLAHSTVSHRYANFPLASWSTKKHWTMNISPLKNWMLSKPVKLSNFFLLHLITKSPGFYSLTKSNPSYPDIKCAEIAQILHIHLGSL